MDISQNKTKQNIQGRFFDRSAYSRMIEDVENQKERLQYLTAGTEGTTQQGAGYGAITDKAAG